MKIAASALALVLVSGVAAYAQGTMAPAAPKAGATSSDQCWDMATNALKNTNAATASQGATGSASAQTPKAAPPMAPSGSSTTGAATRPAGVPNC